MYNPPSSLIELTILIKEEAAQLGEYFLIYMLDTLNNPTFYSLKRECLKITNHSSIRNLLIEYEENNLKK